MTGEREALIVGAGPAGLSAAAMMKSCGVAPLLLEREDRLGGPWRRHYDRLELQSPSWLSNLPGHRFAREDGRWVTRDAFVRYLGRYARHFGLKIEYGVSAHRIDRADDGWRIKTDRGPREARTAVVATGYNRVPHVPGWLGREAFRGELLHASAFRNATPFRGRDVLVVGAGNTGAEIALVLAEGGASRVRLAVRTPPNVVPRSALGLPSLLLPVWTRRLPTAVADLIMAALARPFVGNLTRHGLARAPFGISRQYAMNGVTPILDTGFVRALKRGRIEVVAAVTRFDGAEVVLADGARIAPSAVIAATGYRRGLDPLVGHLGVLAADGRPLVDGPEELPDALGLHFIGFTHPLTGNLRQVKIDSRKLGRVVADRARSAPTRRAGDVAGVRPREVVTR